MLSLVQQLSFRRSGGGGEHVDDEGHHGYNRFPAGGLQAAVARLPREEREVKRCRRRLVLERGREPRGALLVVLEILEQPGGRRKKPTR